MPFHNITLVSIDGRGGELFEAQCALRVSQRELPGANTLLLSPGRPKKLLDGIVHVEIQPLGYLDYGLFLIYALHRFIKTDFALIVQSDGWVLNGRQWKDEYFNYDYIGAPTHFARVTTGKEVKYQCNFEWIGQLGNPACQVDYVLNGGFSLRSKRFLEAPTTLNIPFQLTPPSHLPGPPYRMYWDNALHCEDVQLCFNMRSELERAGLKFAPLNTARNFAFENIYLSFHDGLDLSQCLGHHSQMRKLKSYDPRVVEYQLTKEELTSILGENLMGQYFQMLGYTLEFAFKDPPPLGVRKFDLNPV